MFSGRFSNPESDVVRKNSRWGVLGPGEQNFSDAVAGGMVHAVPIWIKEISSHLNTQAVGVVKGIMTRRLWVHLKLRNILPANV